MNCLTIIFFDEALERARELDEIFAKTKKPVGAYHGLPFSIKDHFDIKGKVSSCCYVAWADAVAEEDELLVKMIRDAGAVFYCKTNMPQTAMHLESNNNLWGRTLNPYNRGLTSGGSSGGESALIAFRGSPIGLGSDGGGSIRAPAAFCGLYGFKPTSNRTPATGVHLPMIGNDASAAGFAPLCRSARDDEFFMKFIVDQEPWKTEPVMPPVPWKVLETPKKLTIGVIYDDEVVRPHPPITNAMKKVVEKLSAHPDITIKEWKPYQHARGYDIIRRLYFQDGGKFSYDLMEKAGEPVLPLTEWVFKESHTKMRTIPESWRINVERETFRSK